MIFSRNEVLELLKKIKYFPCKINDVCRIMFGEHRGKIIRLINSKESSNMSEVLDLIHNSNYAVPISSLKYLGDFDKLGAEKFIEFLKIMIKLNRSDQFLELGDIKINGNQKNMLEINNIMQINDVHISINFQFAKKFIGDQIYLGGSEYCRNRLLSCECLAWREQSEEFHLCPHLINTIFNIWNSKNVLDDTFEISMNVRDFILLYLN